MKTIQRRYRVDRRQIGFIRFIVEAYDGLAVLTTEDPEPGNLRFAVASGCEDEFDQLMRELGKEILIEEAIGDRF